jgi:hypothetical protein
MRHMLILVMAAGLAAAGWQPDASFWQVWGDGQAELAGYDLTFPRYGQARRGTAVTIFVSETFSNSARVKADPGGHPDSDLYPVMKLNLIEDYQTGIYDYNDMASVFVQLAAVNGRPAGSLTKVSSSSQEWCGQTYQQALFDKDKVRYTLHSYFDQEGDQQKDLPHPASGISEDQLLLWARGMAQPFLTAGQTVEVPMLAGLRTTRQAHRPIGWGKAKLSRSSKSETLQWNGKPVTVEVYQASIEGGVTRTYYVETAAPKRVLKWKSSTGEEATLLASKRLKYWQMNREGFEKELPSLGLQARPRRMM